MKRISSVAVILIIVIGIALIMVLAPKPEDPADRLTIYPSIAASQESCLSSCEIQFDASGTTSSPTKELFYAWDFGDKESEKNIAFGSLASHIFKPVFTISESQKTFTITLVVDDKKGNSINSQVTVTIFNPYNASCGNGLIDSGEVCDDGNSMPRDGCSPVCKIESGWSCSGKPSNCTLLPSIPLMPINFSAINLTSTKIYLEWKDNSSNEKGFYLERRSNLTKFKIIATLPANATNFTDSELVASTTYFYRIQSHNPGGYSNYSNASVTTNKPKPGAPSNLQVTATSSTEIALTWQDNSPNEEGFYLERALYEEGPFSRISIIPANTQFYKDYFLIPTRAYFYRIQSFNSGNSSGFSNIVSSTTLGVAPNASLNLQAFTLNSTAINLTWRDNSDNEEGFHIFRRASLLDPFEKIATVQNKTTYLDSSLTQLTTYYYTVRTYNSVGMSPYSNTATNTTKS